MRRHVRAYHSALEPYRVLYFCGRCFKFSTRHDSTALHVRRTHALAPEIVKIHIAHEVNRRELNVKRYIRRFLPDEEDPLVVLAPFNPFSTVVQIWLSHHDPSYSPLYVDTQENLGNCDQWPRASASYIELDRDIVPNTEVSHTLPNFLETEDTPVQEPVPEPVLDHTTGNYTLFTQAETTRAVASITEPGVAPVVSYSNTAVASYSYESSTLEDYSDVVAGPSPSNFDLSNVDQQLEVGPELMNLVDTMESELPEELANINTIDIQPTPELNINPHHNMFSPLVISDDESITTSDNDLPSLVSVTSDLQIPPFFDLFTLGDITNTDQWNFDV